MMRARSIQALGVALAVSLPVAGDAQMVGRSAAPQRMGGEMRVPTIVRESSLPPMRMGSLPQQGPVIVRDRGYYDPGYSLGFGRSYASCYYNSYCRGYAPYRSTYVRSTYNYVNVQSTYLDWPWFVPVVLYNVPVYTTFWAPGPARVWSPAAADSQTPAPPADPTKSRMLTIGTGADGGGGVMRIETVSDSVARVTWLGTTRPIRQARLFLADSVQQSLRGALVDQETPSALFKFADLAPRVAYVGLTITFANGSIETTLVPYAARSERKP